MGQNWILYKSLLHVDLFWLLYLWACHSFTSHMLSQVFTVIICSTPVSLIMLFTPGKCLVSYGYYSLISPFAHCKVTDEGHCCHGRPSTGTKIAITQSDLDTSVLTCVVGGFIDWRSISWLITYLIYFTIVVIHQKMLELSIPRSAVCSVTHSDCLQVVDCNIMASNLNGHTAISLCVSKLEHCKVLCPA